SFATKRFGKKKIAFSSLLIGSLLLSTLVFAKDYYVALSLVFISSVFLSLALPAVNGVYADLIQENGNYEEEIEVLTDFYTNLGYILGPMAAGFIADVFGNAASISGVGIFGVLVALVLIKITPRHIDLRKDILQAD
nr:MFS transporter [Candidatus Woesebacteria bacterium]